MVLSVCAEMKERVNPFDSIETYERLITMACDIARYRDAGRVSGNYNPSSRGLCSRIPTVFWCDQWCSTSGVSRRCSRRRGTMRTPWPATRAPPPSSTPRS
jgi:hypothetical protein